MSESDVPAAYQMAGLRLSQEGAAGTCPGTPAATPSLQQDELACPPTVPIVPAGSAADPEVSVAAAASAEQSADLRTRHYDDAAAGVARTLPAAAALTPPVPQLPAPQPVLPAGSIDASNAQKPEAPAAAARCPALSLVIIPPNTTPEVGWYMLWQIMLLYSDKSKAAHLSQMVIYGWNRIVHISWSDAHS